MSRVTIDVGKRHIREINQEMQAAAAAGHAIDVVNTLSRHNLGVGLPPGCDISFEGSVGYYCGGLNTGAKVTVEGNAGWAVGEGMSDGHITVGGYAGMSCGAAMMGGTIHVKGDAGPRCGVSLKGGNIVVEGKIGYQSGFMSHAGKIIAMGGAGESCADALWEGEVWVAGDIASFGVDVKVIEPTAEEVAEVDAILKPLGIEDSSLDWRKMISGQRLWYFEARDANAWLMI
ncbi:glutamate synthase [Alphaproteobacteria bacterium]|jgi:methylamine---glutamate N-methyltransferase subunit B|nr:glutamate synthase [Alphaproteobacteria bacterium]